MKEYRQPARRGDRGDTVLATGEERAKDDIRVDSYGSVDELNSTLGMALEMVRSDRIKGVVRQIQHDLFCVGCDLATPLDGTANAANALRTSQAMCQELEKLVHDFTDELPPLKNFILPGGSPGAAALHMARSVCRRAERRVVALGRQQPIGEHTPVYLNRLSDLLFMLARYENFCLGIADTMWAKPLHKQR